jgi:hypothetical protein
MADLEMVLKAIDEMTPEQLRQLYAYLAERQIEAIPQESKSAPAKRVLGLHAHLGPAWTSDDFDAPLPDDFWLGEE